MEAVIFGKSCEYRFLANCRDLPCFCDFTRHLLLKVNCNFFLRFQHNKSFGTNLLLHISHVLLLTHSAVGMPVLVPWQWRHSH